MKTVKTKTLPSKIEVAPRNRSNNDDFDVITPMASLVSIMIPDSYTDGSSGFTDTAPSSSDYSGGGGDFGGGGASGDW